MENQRSLFIGNAIRTARKQQKITQEDLAKLVGVGKVIFRNVKKVISKTYVTIFF